MGLDVKDLKKRLEKTECPPLWNIEKLERRNVESMVDKLEEKNEEIAGQLWRNITLELAIIYEHMKQSEYSVCSQKLHDCLTWVKNSDESDFVKKNETSFLHLLLSLKSFIEFEKGDFYEASRTMNLVPDLNKMSSTEQAAVYGIKSNVLTEYGVGGTREAFVWARKALELDKSEPEWYFLLGKLHTRQRNYCLIREPSAEENEALEKAYQLCRKAHTAVYLAASYSNRSKLIYFRLPMAEGKKVVDPKVEIELKKLNQRALELYKEAMDLNEGQCLHILVRCAYGFATLPDEYQNTKLALELAEEVLRKSPSNCMVHSLLSVIYRNRREFTAAILHAQQSARNGAFGSHLKYFTLLISGKKEFDVVSRVEQTLQEFPLDIYRIQLFIFVSNYFLFVKGDLFKSLPYFKKAVKLDPQFNLLKDRYVRWVKVYLNLYELMYNEVICAIQKEKYANETELKGLLKNRDLIAAAWPQVKEMTIERDLVNKLKERCIAHLRSRPRTRKNKKAYTKKNRQKDKNEPRKRLKSTQSVSARSKEGSKTNGSKMRSASSDKLLNRRTKKEQLNDFFSSQKGVKHKRALSQDGRSLSRECPKKMFKEMQNLVKTIDDMASSEVSLRPDSSLQNTSISLERCLSQLSIERDSAPREIPFIPRNASKQRKSNDFSKRSVSFDRQLMPQKRISAAMSPLQPRSDKECFFPDFKTPSSVKQYDSLTVENVERLKNSVRRDSLDSDDTLESQMSNLSVRESSHVGVCSVTSVSVTTNRSLSLDDSQRSVSSSKNASQPCASDWATMSENDPYVTKFVPESPGGVKEQQSGSRFGLINKKLSNVEIADVSFKPGWSNQISLAQRMRDLSIENKQHQGNYKRSTVVGSSQRGNYHSGGQKSQGHYGGSRDFSGGAQSHRGGYDHFGVHTRGSQGHRGGSDHSRGHSRGAQGQSYGDRRSPFGRDKSNEGRVLRPPGMRPRAESETSTSSADSDYVASRWRIGGLGRHSAK
ncbi:hypothetical protein GE061_002601 [Apolygus lucorum]|uniref:Uncharacterized protein n=1 Tax=Apolygus lucorum TaxID=248454 RepID=A0A8S9X7F1_APOLU|nr:hypothetical protein GE061_002601 [Apolygus lucorum]